MRNISFALTTEQIRNRTKTVTRRLGWLTIQPGTLLQACEKCQGLKPGEKLKKLCVIRVKSIHRGALRNLLVSGPAGFDDLETDREGFPGVSRQRFVDMFCELMDCEPGTWVTRIEFEYV